MPLPQATQPNSTTVPKSDEIEPYYPKGWYGSFYFKKQKKEEVVL